MSEMYCLLRPKSRKLGAAHPFSYTLALARENPTWPLVSLEHAKAQLQVNAQQTRLRFAAQQVKDGQALQAETLADMAESDGDDSPLVLDNVNEMSEEEVQRLMAETNEALAEQAGAPTPPPGYGDTDTPDNDIDFTQLSEDDLRAYHINHFGVPIPNDTKTKVAMINFIRQSEAEKREGEAELASQ